MKSRHSLLAFVIAAATAGAQQIVNVVETGGDNEPTDTIVAQWTGQTFPVSINGEPLPELIVGDEYTVGLFGDFAPGFVDRNHRYINSTSATNPPEPPVDIPPYLIDLPYIMSGNDNRDNSQYRLDITVDAAARVYMLIDNRLPDGVNSTPPSFGPSAMQWILDQDWTPMLTGNNRFEDPTIPDELAFDEGANGDIQQWYSIYFRDVPAGTFSIFQADNANRNMYGVVVGPLPPPTDPIQAFIAQPTTLAFGEKARLSWQIATDAISATIDNGVGDVKALTDASGAGSIEVTPTLPSTAYTLTVTTPGTTKTAGALVTIPLIRSFTITPGAVNPGQSATLAWQVFPGGTIEIDPLGDVTAQTNATGAGSLEVTPTRATGYTLTVVREADSATATAGIGFLPPTQRFAFIDIGATGGQPEPGATGDRVVGAATADVNGPELFDESLMSDTGDEFFLSIEAIDQDDFPVGRLDWRDRGNAPAVPLARLAEDHVKNNDGMIRVTLGSLPAGTYEVTSYHIDPTFSQSEEIMIFVKDAVSGGSAADTGVIASAAYEGHPENTNAIPVAGLNTFNVSEKAFTYTVTSNGLDPVVIYFDSRFAPIDREVPLGGLLIVPVATPPATPVALTIALVDDNQVRLSWPAEAPASIKLQTTTTLATQSWIDDVRPVTVVGNEKVVSGPLDGPIRYFRLVQP